MLGRRRQLRFSMRLLFMKGPVNWLVGIYAVDIASPGCFVGFSRGRQNQYKAWGLNLWSLVYTFSVAINKIRLPWTVRSTLLCHLSAVILSELISTVLYITVPQKKSQSLRGCSSLLYSIQCSMFILGFCGRCCRGAFRLSSNDSSWTYSSVAARVNVH